MFEAELEINIQQQIELARKMSEYISVKLEKNETIRNILQYIEDNKELFKVFDTIEGEFYVEILQDNPVIKDKFTNFVNANKGIDIPKLGSIFAKMYDAWSLLADDIYEYDNTDGHTDAIGMYFTEMSRIPLYTPQEEFEATTKYYNVTNKLNDLISKNDDSQKEEIEKLKKEQDEIGKDIANHNLRLAAQIAKRYIGHNVDYEDLIQFGNEGLLKAITRYDPTKGYRFSTYATWWIKQSISRSVADTGRTVRYPVHLVEQINKWVKIQRDFYKENGRAATDEEVSNIMGVPESIVEKLRHKATTEAISLNSAVGDDGDSELQDFVVAKTKTPEEEVIDNSLRENMIALLESGALTDKEKYIIEERMGFYGEPRTLEDISDDFDITRERIRQIEAKALRKLRVRIKRTGSELWEYLDNPDAVKKKFDNTSSYIPLNYNSRLKEDNPIERKLKKDEK